VLPPKKNHCGAEHLFLVLIRLLDCLGICDWPYSVGLDCSCFFFSGEETVIMMTKDFDPILEFPCHSEEFGEGVFSVYL